VNNLDTAIFPTIGTQQIYITVTANQVSGYDADTITVTSTLLMTYHNGFPDTLPHYADNTLRQNGVDVRLENEMGDIPGAAVAPTTPGLIQRFISAPRTAAVGNIAWDSNGRYLANVVAEQIARKSFRSHQYYELELDGNVSYNHTTLWGSTYYKPINLSISERSTRVTYREIIDGNLLAAPI
jgi:hypothetical protein